MRWIVGSSLRFRWLVVFAAAVLTALGIAQIPSAKVDVFPEFAPPRVEIQTIALGNSSSEVEELITVPIEDQLNGLPGLDQLRSKSVSQLSSIQLIFDRGTDELRARQLVQERLSQVTAELPRWASPPWMMPPVSATSRIMKIGLSSNEHDLLQLSSTAYWKINQRLMRVPGVAHVDTYGERLQQRHVQVDPALLARYGVSLQRVMAISADALDAGLLQYSDGAVVGTGGFVETGGQRLNIRNVQAIETPEELAQVPVLERGGRTLRLADMGRVLEDHIPLWGEAVVNDGPGLLLIVQKYRGANTMEVTRGVERAVEEMRPGLPGIELDTTIFRPATFIEQSNDNLTLALLVGVGLVILIIAAFLFDWRTAFISLVAIPLSLLAAILVLDLAGRTINVMVLAGLVVAIGVVVDDAIIDVENIVRRLRLARAEGSGVSTFSIVLDASVEVRSAITYATVINVVAIVPVFLLQGLSGSFFQPLVLSYGLAVLVSMLVALTVTPALCLIFMSRGRLLHRESPLLAVLKRGYGAILARVIRRPSPAIATAAALLVAGLLIFPTLGSSLLPNFKERDFLMHWLTQPGTGVQEEQRVSIRACKDLREIPGVRNCGSHIGQALLSDEIYGVDFGENWISVDPDVDYDKTLASIHRTVEGYPGLYRDVQTYLRERIKEVLTGTSESVVVRIFGPDLDVMREQADVIEKKIGGIDGIVDAHADLQENLPHIEVELDLAAARRHGLKPGDIRRQSSTLLASEEVGDLFYGGKAYDVHVWSIPSARDSVTDVERLPIDTPDGGRIRLAELAAVRLAPTPNAIEREQQSRRIDVGANIERRDLASVVDDVDEALETVEFPRGHHAEVLGESTELNAAQSRLLLFGIAAAIAIFLLLHAAFGSLRLAILTFLLLPMALVGGVLAVWLGDGVLSLGSLVGFLTVFGIAARNGILMVSHFQHLERFEGEAFGPALVLRGARERLAPILMTALATGLALVPLAVAGSIPGHEIEHPMAIVILGGLVTATLLNLFVLPALYLRFAKPASAPPERREADRARPMVVTALLVASVFAGTELLGPAEARAQEDPVEEAGCTRLVDYGAARFGRGSHRVEHPLLPLKPGTQRVFEGRSNVTGEALPHRVTFTVTSLTKVVDGVRTAVVWDVDETDGELAETELAVFAEDKAGNVWNLGEYPEEYPDGVFEGAPNTWFAGVGEAEPGIHMPAKPTVGVPEYLQGWVPDIEFLDCATIVESGASVCVPAGCFSDVLVIHERSPLDPAGGIQVKYHAPGVGIVQIGAIDDPEAETLVLTEFNQLGKRKLRKANREAHILDQRGLMCSDVYAQTEPVEGPDDGDFGPFTCAPPEPPEPPPTTGGTTTPAPFLTAPAAIPPEPSAPEPRYRDSVDHPLFPLAKVRTMLYEGSDDDVTLRIRSRVRSERVRVAGVLATAVDVTDREDGKLVERSTDYYVHDSAGNVWYLGERVDEISGGKVVSHDGQWIAGRKGAKRGLFLPAAPQVGQSFRQTRAPGVSQDRSKVVALDAALATPAGRFTGCMKTRDRELRSDSRPEFKFYCPNVGLVREQQDDGIVELVSFG